MDRSHRRLDAPHLKLARAAPAVAVLVLAATVGAQTPPEGRPVHIVLVGDSTVTEGSGWGLGFRQLVAPEVRVTNTAQNGRSSKSFRDEGHWATALAARGDYYLIQFGHNDQPGKGSERETDPASTFPANMARYVEEVRTIGATPILVTSLVRRTFGELPPDMLTSTLGPWVEAVKRVAAEKRVPVIDLDASSRALCERLGPVQTSAFDLKKADGTWDTTHLDAAGSAAFARLVVDDLREAVPALAPYLPASTVDVADDWPPDAPAPHPLLSGPNPNTGERGTFGRVYTRSIRLARIRHRESFHGRQPSLDGLPALVTSPAIVVAWDFLPQAPPDGRTDCGYGPAAPRRAYLRGIGPQDRRDVVRPVTIETDPRRIREWLAPFESDVRTVRWVAALDPAGLRPDTLLTWESLRPCGKDPARGGHEATLASALVAPDDVGRWSDRAAAAPP